LKKKISTNAAAARLRITAFLSDRLPIRITACNTTASTAHLRPKNSAETIPTLPYSV
jgi:hypothetical protein